MTILEAVTSVLNRHPNGMTCKEITDEMIARDLYVFNTPDPNTIVRHCLRKHCEGLNFASAHPKKYFLIISGSRGKAIYSLIGSAKVHIEPLPTNEKTARYEKEMLPEEQMEKFYSMHRDAVKDQLLENILSANPSFFEHLVLQLLLKLGYGYGQDSGLVVGKSHDGGIDGIIYEDKLGLDKIYIQAKRYSPSQKISRPMLQTFAGAMETVKKGVYITTSSFTKEAEYAALNNGDKRISLIDGNKLTDLMISCGVGLKLVHTFKTYEVDDEYFTE